MPEAFEFLCQEPGCNETAEYEIDLLNRIPPWPPGLSEDEEPKRIRLCLHHARKWIRARSNAGLTTMVQSQKTEETR